MERYLLCSSTDSKKPDNVENNFFGLDLSRLFIQSILIAF